MSRRWTPYMLRAAGPLAFAAYLLMAPRGTYQGVAHWLGARTGELVPFFIGAVGVAHLLAVGAGARCFREEWHSRALIFLWITPTTPRELLRTKRRAICLRQYQLLPALLPALVLAGRMLELPLGRHVLWVLLLVVGLRYSVIYGLFLQASLRKKTLGNYVGLGIFSCLAYAPVAAGHIGVMSALHAPDALPVVAWTATRAGTTGGAAAWALWAAVAVAAVVLLGMSQLFFGAAVASFRAKFTDYAGGLGRTVDPTGTKTALSVKGHRSVLRDEVLDDNPFVLWGRRAIDIGEPVQIWFSYGVWIVLLILLSFRPRHGYFSDNFRPNPLTLIGLAGVGHIAALYCHRSVQILLREKANQSAELLLLAAQSVPRLLNGLLRAYWPSSRLFYVVVGVALVGSLGVGRAKDFVAAGAVGVLAVTLPPAFAFVGLAIAAAARTWRAVVGPFFLVVLLAAVLVGAALYIQIDWRIGGGVLALAVLAFAVPFHRRWTLHRVYLLAGGTIGAVTAGGAYIVRWLVYTRTFGREENLLASILWVAGGCVASVGLLWLWRRIVRATFGPFMLRERGVETYD
jgi:hypothetical protein